MRYTTALETTLTCVNGKLIRMEYIPVTGHNCTASVTLVKFQELINSMETLKSTNGAIKKSVLTEPDNHHHHQQFGHRHHPLKQKPLQSSPSTSVQMDYIQALESKDAFTHAQTAYPKLSEHHAPPPPPKRQPPPPPAHPLLPITPLGVST